MKFLFMTESSPTKGTGHIMRSLALAEAMRRRGHLVTFFPKTLCTWGRNLAKSRGFQLSTPNVLDEVAQSNLTVMDGYGFTATQMASLMEHSKLAVIEDFLHRAVVCHVLLDPNIGGDCAYFENDQVKFEHYIGGSNYLTLDDSVTTKHPLPPTIKPRNLLISFGGSDPSCATEKVLDEVVQSENLFDRIAVVIGPLFGKDRRSAITASVASSGIEVIGPFTSLGFLYQEFRWAIGAGGTSAYERVFHMIPSLNLITHANQVRLASNLSNLGVALKTDVRGNEIYDIKARVKDLVSPQMEQDLIAYQKRNVMDRGASNVAEQLEGYLRE